MAILIGGSPSTGSSLLRRILNRHTSVFCGSETSLFTKKPLYKDWTANKHRLFRRSIAGLHNAGWHHFNGFILDDDYPYSKDDLKPLIEESDASFHEFIVQFYKPILKNSTKTIWAEKTPSNVFVFMEFLSAFPDGKTIHIVRHPLDTIASLINRGMSVFNACSVYLLNTAEGLTYEDNPKSHLVKYEDLVLQPENTVKELCSFLNIPFELDMIEQQEASDGNDYMEGWRYKETGLIGSASIGRFDSIDKQLQNEILFILDQLNSKLRSEYSSILNIAAYLKYQLPDYESDTSQGINLSLLLKKDALLRNLKASYFNASNYPLYVKS